MAIYLDSASLDEARQVRNFAWVHGVTTNPSLMAKAGKDAEVILGSLDRLGFQKIYYQLVSQNLDDMLTEAYKAQEIVKEGLVLKVAPTEVGYRFVSDHANRFACCVTAVFSPMQALIACEVRARYVAVYVNRATKQMGDGLALVGEVGKVLAGRQTEIVAASLKSPKEAMDASLAGAAHITIPFEVLVNLHTHPLSVQTLEQFAAEGVGIRLKS